MVVLLSKTVHTGGKSTSVFNVKRAVLLIIEGPLQPVCLGNTVSGPNRGVRVCVREERERESSHTIDYIESLLLITTLLCSETSLTDLRKPQD